MNKILDFYLDTKLLRKSELFKIFGGPGIIFSTNFKYLPHHLDYGLMNKRLDF